MLKGFFEAVGVLISREELGREAPPSREPRPSFISLILQPEQLPAPAVSVPPRRTPKSVIEQIMRLQRLEHPAALARSVPEDLRHINSQYVRHQLVRLVQLTIWQHCFASFRDTRRAS